MMNEKGVDEKTFKECCDEMLRGRMHPDVAAYLTGLSRPTFRKRVNQYYDPERYGELPPDFFGHGTDKYITDKKWAKDSAAVRKYKEREEERKRKQKYKEEYRQMLKHRNEFLKADDLPKLEE